MFRRIRILKSTVAFGERVSAGAIIDVPVDEAYQLVHARRAEFFNETVSAGTDETDPD